CQAFGVAVMSAVAGALYNPGWLCPSRSCRSRRRRSYPSTNYHSNWRSNTTPRSHPHRRATPHPPRRLPSPLRQSRPPQRPPPRTQSPADLQQTIASITERLYPFPDDTIVLPGHGGDTTIADSKREFAVFASREHPPDLHGDVLWEA